MASRDPLKRVINKDTCFNMAYTLAEHKHRPIINKLEKELKECGQLIYNLIHKGMLKEINEVPKGWLKESAYITVRSPDGRASYTYYRRFSYVDDNGSRVRPSTTAEHSISLPKAARLLADKDFYKLSHQEPLLLKYFELERQVLQERENVSETRERMEGIISGYRTYARLYEGWPEVRALVKKYEPSVTVTPSYPVALPNTKALNAEFGLPLKQA